MWFGKSFGALCINLCGNEITEMDIENSLYPSAIHDIVATTKATNLPKYETQEHLLDRRAVTTTHAAIHETLKLIVQHGRLTFYKLRACSIPWQSGYIFHSAVTPSIVEWSWIPMNAKIFLIWITNCGLQTWAILFNCIISAYNTEWTSKNSITSVSSFICFLLYMYTENSVQIEKVWKKEFWWLHHDIK